MRYSLRVKHTIEPEYNTLRGLHTFIKFYFRWNGMACVNRRIRYNCNINAHCVRDAMHIRRPISSTITEQPAINSFSVYTFRQNQILIQ